MAEYKVDFQETIEDAFLNFAGHVILQRAIPDARDGLKYGARQGLYAQFHEGITHEKPYSKAQKSVSAGTSLCYVHGPVSLYDTLIRMGKPFAFRYPLQDVQGNFGNPMLSDSHAAERYVEMRQSELASYLFEGIKKNAIEKWNWNYDDTEQIPSVLPSPFFYNIVNGATGIGVGMATSIPTFNLREVNKALALLVINPDATFEELYCPIDFPTYGTIINEEQVKESLRSGNGKSAVVRAKLEYNVHKHQIVVTQMPFMVYTETICTQLGQLLDNDPTIAIERVLDATKVTPRIEITLAKKADPEAMKAWLYANTSLQAYYQINMTMLDEGKKPRIFGWREALLAHVNHMRIVKRREFEFDLNKAIARLHIVKGLLIAIEHIDAFIEIIKSSESVAEAAATMRAQYDLSDLQAKAVLDIRLARLVSLEYVKVQKEASDLQATIEDITNLLADQARFNKVLVDGLDYVAKRFGDERRTINIDVAKESEERRVEMTSHEEMNVTVTFTNSGTFYLSPDIAGNQKKKIYITLDPKDYVVEKVYGSRSQSVILFTKSGLAYTVDLNKLDLNKQYNFYSALEIGSQDRIVAAIHSDAFVNNPSIVSVTKEGMIKKSAAKEFLGRKKGGLAVMKTKDGDEIVSIRVSINETDDILLLTANGYTVRFAQSEIGSTGRVTQGVKGVKLGADDYVVNMIIVPQELRTAHLLTITAQGVLKKTPLTDFAITGRYVKGTIGHRPADGDRIVLGAMASGANKVVVGAANTSTEIFDKVIPIGARGTGSKYNLTIQAGATINYLAEVFN